MAKALYWTDHHIHAHKDRVDRLHHCLDVLDWVFKKAAEHNVKYMFFLGDLFHDRSKIDILIYLKTFEIFMKHMIEDAADRDVYLLVGNHDIYHKERWDINSVKPFTAIPRVKIIDKPMQLNIEGKKIDCLPYTDNPVKVLGEFKKNNSIGEILLAHVAVHGATLNMCYGTKADVIVEYDNDMVAVDSSLFSDWKMTLLGHYHGAQNLPNNVEYVGSPLELSFGEAFQEKHIMILDLETMEKEYIINDFSPKHLILTPREIESETYNLNGNFLRLSVDQLSNVDLMDFKKKFTTEYKVLSFDTKINDQKTEENETIISDAKVVLKDIKQALGTWVKERGVPEKLDKNKLETIGLKCLESIEKVAC